MRKFSVIFLILSLILSTVFIKNSTKKIEDEIFASEENIRVLKKEFEKIKLEFDYLSSAENLLKFQNLYFDDELTKKNILKIKVINNDSFDIE
mgnify:FL=1|tara:strand:- start:180 stop:458 length:279 start_codon:yes stop_codon:yes gene_type:complete